MEKMTQMLVVKVTQLQGQHLGSEDPPCPAGAPSAWGCGCQQDPCVPVQRGAAVPLGRPSCCCRKHPDHSRASPWGGAAAGLPQGQTICSCPAIPTHLPVAAHQLGKLFFLLLCFFKNENIFLLSAAFYPLLKALTKHFHLPSDSSCPVFPAALLSWVSQTTTSK